MSVFFFTADECEAHEMGPGHPECPGRLSAINSALKRDNLWQQLNHQTPEMASAEQISLAHDVNYIQWVFKNSPHEDYFTLDPDTQMNSHSLSAARSAAGAAIQSVDAVLSRSASPEVDSSTLESAQLNQKTSLQAFCSVRPPGHHAEFGKAMGFCLFNSIAIAAKYATQKYQLQRIAIIDFDVHHGNGTENIIAEDESIHLYSSFQWPFYPNSGIPPSAPNVHNFPLNALSGSEEIRTLWNEQLLPMLNQYQPELILISAGFDAHRDDPLAQLNWVDLDYYFFAKELKKVAEQYADGRLIACLEGGYNLEALGNSVSQFIQALID